MDKWQLKLSQNRQIFDRKHGEAQVTDESPAQFRTRLVREKVPLQEEIRHIKRLLKGVQPHSIRQKQLLDQQFELAGKLTAIDRHLADIKGNSQESRDTITAAWPRMFVEVARHTLTEELFTDLCGMTNDVLAQWAEEDMKQFEKIPFIKRSIKRLTDET